MPTIVTVVNATTGKHYAIKIPPVQKDAVITCTVHLLSYSKERQEFFETFVEKYEAPDGASYSEILEKGRKIVNSYRS